jgi:glycosyltransferase family protein
MISKMIDGLRKITPLPLRKKIGPSIGYVVYFWRTRLRGKTWEPQILSTEETLKKIHEESLSVIRFGDGELSLIAGSDLAFQKYDPNLANKLRVILSTKHFDLLLCLPNIFGRLENFAKIGYWFEIHHLFRYANLWKDLVLPNYVYGDAFITRPYLSYKDKSKAGEVYQQIKKLWQNQDVVLVEGEKSRLGVGNDLFNDVHSLQRILGPAENAYAKSDVIIEEVSKLSKNHLILISLGPAAKVIAYELFLKGYRVFDIGHVDMEYEMFLRGSDKIVPVPYKYFNEINEREPETYTDSNYQSQIIAKFI